MTTSDTEAARAAMARSTVIGVDVGGTFTDIVGLDQRNRLLMIKTPSDPDDPAGAVLRGIGEFAAAADADADALLSQATIVHGTTMGINTLITRTGAKTGLLCTSGFRDTLEIRVGYKEERYELDLPPPQPLVPRRHRLPVRERVDGRGRVVTPLVEADVLAACDQFAAEGVEAIAICFLWSFLDPGHEQRAAEICAQAMPGAFITTSWEVLPEMREYDRVSTTVLNAYIGPRVVAYLRELERRLRAEGMTGSVLYLQSHGGVAHADEVTRVPVRTLLSGPAAGPSVARYFAAATGHANAICIDMGGTSFDASVVTDGAVRQTRPVTVDGVRVGLPMVDVHSVGGGGGSIAHIDAGILRVGPRSAGAVPGPACYNLGGESPTVTDANLMLGVYGEGPIAGDLWLTSAPAVGALDGLGAQVGVGAVEAAAGIRRVVTIDLAQAVRDITVAEGRDPRDYVLIAGGGSGPAHCCAIAEELGISEIIVPKAASTLCALGAIVTDVVYEMRRSLPTQLNDATDTGAIREALDRLEADLIARLQGEGHDDLEAQRAVGLRYREDDLHVEHGFELRYREQLWEIMVPIAGGQVDDEVLATAVEDFHVRHHNRYAYSEPETPCELVSLAVRATVHRPVPAIDWDLALSSQWRRVGVRTLRIGEDDRVEAGVFDGTAAPQDVALPGPALIVEPLCSVVVAPGWTARLHHHGAYVLDKHS